MKAIVYTRPNEVQLRDLPMPVPMYGEVVLRVEAAGICGSDMHAWRGHDPRRKPGLVLGHEFAGSVAESAVPGFEPGMRCTGNPLITCGVCEYCARGRNNLCVNRSMVGMTRPGAFAEYMSIPAASLLALPRGMPARAAALTEPAASVWHALGVLGRACERPIHESRVLVLGGGAIGMLSALLLRHLGAMRVTLTERNELRYRAAAAHAGCAVLGPYEVLPPGATFEVVIDTVGAKATCAQALAVIKPGGVVVHVGLQDCASEIDMRRLTLAEITLLGAYAYTTADLCSTVDALARGVFGDLAWVEERPLALGAQAFIDLEQGRCAAAKIVLRP